ncbi:MAG: hypothetical protein LBI04_01945 [Treponema sp.]|jgi:hypothetical protein|nr:hypothetical protein [Treponema sp.]
MKIKLTVEINCNNDRCGDCDYLEMDDMCYPICGLFGDDVRGDKIQDIFKKYDFKNPYRSPCCLAAEIKEAEK